MTLKEAMQSASVEYKGGLAKYIEIEIETEKLITLFKSIRNAAFSESPVQSMQNVLECAPEISDKRRFAYHVEPKKRAW